MPGCLVAAPETREGAASRGRGNEAEHPLITSRARLGGVS